MTRASHNQDGQLAEGSQAWTIGRLLEWTTGYLRDKGVESPRLATELLLSHALGCQKIELYTRFAEVPSGDALARFRGLVVQAAEHRPVAYLIGRREFYSLSFEIDASVLIPRPETERLVEQAILHGQARPVEPLHVLDLGTGSGCVGLTICHYLPHARVVGSDISEDALAVARRNAEHLGLSARFSAVQADGLALPAESVPPGGFDLLVSNPPYVSSAATETLSPQVRDHEPHQALFGGQDGLDFYRLIADQARNLLKSCAAIFLEIGYDQHDAVRAIMTAAGWHHAESWCDFNEGHLRVMCFDQTTGMT